MPIYEYQCDDCGDRTEVLQRLSDDKLKECGKCGGALQRLISAPAVQFKGTGWYVTDYGGRKGAGDSGEGSKGSDSSSGSESSSSKGASEGAGKTAGKAASSSPSD